MSPVEHLVPGAAAAKSSACAEAAGAGQLLVILDFDRTLTSNFMPDGARVTSAHGILEAASVLSETFQAKAKELFSKYYPIEIDAVMPAAETLRPSQRARAGSKGSPFRATRLAGG
ncbi:unnamed protein product [Effrenium voratum]|nr:unnamed protein product [Effrenium voratum]